MIPRALAILLVLAAASPSAARQDQPVFRSRAEGVTVDVSVRAGGKPVTGLTVADFELFDNGVRQDIQGLSFGPTSTTGSDAALTVERLPMDVTMLLDCSRSVEGNVLDRLKNSVAATTALLKPDDAIRLVAMQDRLREVFAFKRGGTRPLMDGLTARGGTPLLDGLAIAMMRPAKPDRRQLIVAYTDGQDTLSILSPDMAAAVASRSEAVVYVVLSSDPRSPNAGSTTRAAALLKDLAARTGGQVFLNRPNDPLAEAFASAVDAFRTSYVLRYTPQGVRRGGWHDITVRVKTGQYDVKARKGYDGG